MMTGDASVNLHAPVLCCTAEILANVALRNGPDSHVDQVVMDEFHFYSDPDRGWAWQVPLLELPRVQFIVMSATFKFPSRNSLIWLAATEGSAITSRWLRYKARKFGRSASH